MSNKCKPGCESHEVKLRGPRGFRGDKGNQGVAGPSGAKGDTGPAGGSGSNDVNVIAANDITVSSAVVSGVTTYTVGRTIIDTGWIDLDGFAYYQGTMASKKPQVRRIGSQLHFRGDLIVPIADGAGAAVPMTTEDTYRTTFRVNPETSANNTFTVNGEIFFNSTGSAGGVVIPTTVLGGSVNLDGNYKLNNEIATRQIEINYLGNLPNEPGTALMSSVVQVSLTSSKQLKITALEAREKNSADVANMQGASPLNKLNSQWQVRQEIISHGATSYTIGNRIGDTGVRRPIDNTNTSSPSTLVVGEYYRITDIATGDNFSNVGYGTYQVFKATGTTPTVWTTTKILLLNGLMGQQKSGLRQIKASATDEKYNSPVYPFVLDASGTTVDYALAENLGGMKISLDGLMAYVAPLTP